jgi:hypothetical protein
VNIDRTTQDLIASLIEQHNFLKHFCKQYDEGSENMAKMIAERLRVLLHDTKNSESLLEQLNIKTSTRYCDTALPYNVNNPCSSSYLTVIKSSFDGKKQIDKVCPLYREHNSFHQFTDKEFSSWWNQIVLDDRSYKFSRQDIILLVANKDGGAHIDSKLPKNYYDLTRGDSMGWKICIGKVEKPLRDFYFASIRQIGFEIDLTLAALNINLWRY